MIPLSVLDLAPVPADGTAADALRNTVDLARHAEAWGYHRYWLAEHHNFDGLACSATAVLVGLVANNTQRIRVGSGGVMLPNHAPLIVAEQFGTLATLYPGRIDLGLGRAPGTDAPTMRALRRSMTGQEMGFVDDVMELQNYLGAQQSGQTVRAIPGMGTEVPIWILGSSLYGAQVAAQLGLPYAFASHFAPDLLMQALEAYRTLFRPSAYWPKPHAMVAVNVVAADSDAIAERLFTSVQQRYAAILRGQLGPLLPPIDSMEGHWSPQEEARVKNTLRISAVGSPATVRAKLEQLVAATQADELIVASSTYAHSDRLRSYELLADCWLKDPDR